jgi:hypothetical protein
MKNFSTNPTARVFEGQIYLYPSHDIPAPPGSGANQFKDMSVIERKICLENY